MQHRSLRTEILRNLISKISNGYWNIKKEKRKKSMTALFKQKSWRQKYHQMSDEEFIERVRKRLRRHKSQQVARFVSGIILLGSLALCGWAFYVSLQGFQRLGAFSEIGLLWGGTTMGILISAIGSTIAIKAAYVILYKRRAKVVRLITCLLWCYDRLREHSDQQNKAPGNGMPTKQVTILAFGQFLKWQRSTTSLFGVPLRKSYLKDHAFIEQLKCSISQKKKEKFLWGVILSLFFLALAMTPNFFIPIWRYPFVFGIQWGFLFFLPFEIGILVMIVALRGTEVQRIEELVVKCYDILKEKEHS